VWLWKALPVRLRRRQVLALGALLAVRPRAALADDVSLDAQARWLAGLAPLAGIGPSGEWRTYAQAEDERWQGAQPRLKAMTGWSARQILPLVERDHTLFYPFAGPDVLHAIAIFGEARRMVLVGLEPVGALAEPSRIAPGYFTRLGAALGDMHRLTFFRTQEMATGFQRDGVIAAIVATIARMGGRVTGVQTTTSPPAARIDWISLAGEPRRIDYVQADLANAGLKAQAQLVADLHARAPFVTFVKAAMYLLADARFSGLRRLILDGSAVVVQDDTGLPFRHFDERWAMRFFGRYETPVAPFEAYAQPDLRAAFERRVVGPVPFGIGYHVRPDRSNLLIASKAS
jgi:hypothetical protein